MWRPFANTFAEHTYANFLKKINRVGSAPLAIKREAFEDFANSSSSSRRSVSKEAVQRLEEFKFLKQKVKIQRKKIKETDYHLEKLNEIRIRTTKTSQSNERDRRKQELKRIRDLADNKAPRNKSLSLRPKSPEINDPKTQTFLTFVPQTRKKFFRLASPLTITRSKAHRKTYSVREHQEKIMKNLKSKVPTYFKDLKTEFAKIRNHCEMTFEEYNQSKRLRRTNPYKIKSRSPQYK